MAACAPGATASGLTGSAVAARRTGLRTAEAAFSAGPAGAAVTADAAVWSWGYGGEGRLGHGDQELQLLPKKIEALAGQRVVAVSAARNAPSSAERARGSTPDGARRAPPARDGGEATPGEWRPGISILIIA